MTWETRPLGELFKTAAGGTPSTLNRAYYDGGSVPWLLSGAVRVGVIRECATFITELGLENCNAKMFPRETVLIALYGATAGQVGILDIEAATNQAVLGIYPHKSFLPKFIFYLLLSSYDALIAQAIGNAQPNISGQKVKNVAVPLLPLPEQQRIVGILDEAFAGIATAKANTEKNVRNAQSTFGSFLDYAFTSRDDSWVDHGKPLTDLCELIVDCEHKTAPTQDEGIPSIRTPNIGTGRLLLDGVYRVSEKTYREWTRRAEPRSGDLILAREAPAGNVAVIPDDLRVCLGQRTVLIRPKAAIFDSQFLAFELLRPEMQQKLLAHSRGATVQHVNMKDIRALRIGPVPTLPEQKSIVERIARGSLEGERLESLYQQKLAALDALKKSLLHQAFSGQLAARVPASVSIPISPTLATPSLIRVPGLPPDMLHAGVLALSYQLHAERGNLAEFGHVKAEKIVHLVESHLGYELGRHPVKEAAGPLDFAKRRWVDGRAKSRKWFSFEQTDSGRYVFEPLEKFDFIVSHTRMSLGPTLPELDTFLQWMLRLEWQQAEIVATVYAGWNNLLLDGKQPTDEEIVFESRESWHEAKLKIAHQRFMYAIGWLRTQGVVPTGRGKRVVAKST